MVLPNSSINGITWVSLRKKGLLVGSDESCDIVLKGTHCMSRHCSITRSRDGSIRIALISPDAFVFVNGQPIDEDEQERLFHDDRIIIGAQNYFVLHDATNPINRKEWIEMEKQRQREEEERRLMGYGTDDDSDDSDNSDSGEGRRRKRDNHNDHLNISVESANSNTSLTSARSIGSKSIGSMGSMESNGSKTNKKKKGSKDEIDKDIELDINFLSDEKETEKDSDKEREEGSEMDMGELELPPDEKQEEIQEEEVDESDGYFTDEDDDNIDDSLDSQSSSHHLHPHASSHQHQQYSNSSHRRHLHELKVYRENKMLRRWLGAVMDESRACVWEKIRDEFVESAVQTFCLVGEFFYDSFHLFSFVN
jgi:hypothetical protein